MTLIRSKTPIIIIIKIVSSSAQIQLQKGLIPRPEQNDTFQISVGSGSGISTDCRL